MPDSRLTSRLHCTTTAHGQCLVTASALVCLITALVFLITALICLVIALVCLITALVCLVTALVCLITALVCLVSGHSQPQLRCHSTITKLAFRKNFAP